MKVNLFLWNGRGEINGEQFIQKKGIQRGRQQRGAEKGWIIQAGPSGTHRKKHPVPWNLQIWRDARGWRLNIRKRAKIRACKAFGYERLGKTSGDGLLEEGRLAVKKGRLSVVRAG